MANIVPNFNAKKIFFISKDEILSDKVMNFIKEWNNESDFFLAKTSGSTGIPKEIKLNKKIALEAVKISNFYFKFEEMNSMGLCLSPDTIGGKMQILRALFYNLNLYIFDNQRNPFKHSNQNIDFTTLVPLQMEAILEESPEKFCLISKILLGGAKITRNLRNRISKVPTRCFESYGMTETYSHVAIKNLSDKTDFFTALPGVNFKIEDENLVLQAKHIQNDWIKTNDCAKLIDAGHFELLGRSDFVINSGGYKFHPEVLEEKLENEIPYPYFILGEKNHEFGEIVTFYIEHPHSQNLADDLHQLFLKRLNRYEIPKRVYFIEKFSNTTSGKINKLLTQKQIIEP